MGNGHTSGRIEGVRELCEMLGCSRSQFYKIHFKEILPYLITVENHLKTKRKVKWVSFRELIIAYLLKREQSRNSRK
jgi:hypothetical protein